MIASEKAICAKSKLLQTPSSDQYAGEQNDSCRSPSHRKNMPSTFLTAEWRKLIMAQYTVSPATLAPWLPSGTTLDLYHDRCYVSLIGFLFDRVRIKGIPVPFHTRFEEVNLRFYVRRTEADGSFKRGVVFIRELVPRFAISLIANKLYEEPYATVPMRRSIMHTADSLQVDYGWKYRKKWHTIAAEASPTPQPILPGSEEDFITEHYWGYTKRTRGATSQYGVKHPHWLTYPIRRYKIDADFAALYGPSFAALNYQEPASVLMAEGSEVSVDTGTRLPTS
jgi:uncharacterized protein YqjF (DUF2071 family)